MTWESIENRKPTYAKVTVPERGVVVASRELKTKTRVSRYIIVKIGAGLAKSVGFHAKEQKVRLMFGAGTDAGRVAVALDMGGGGFTARRAANGDYAFTIGTLSAAGRFALSFPSFIEDRIEAIRPQNGQPPMFVFKASAAMLAIEE